MVDDVSRQAQQQVTYDLSQISEQQMKNVAQKEAKATGQSYTDVLTKIETAKTTGQTTITFNTISAPPDTPKLTAPNPNNPSQPMPGGAWNRTQEMAALSILYSVPVFAAVIHEEGETLMKQNEMIRQQSGNMQVQEINASAQMAQDIAQTIRDSAAAQASQYEADAVASLVTAGVSLAQAGATLKVKGKAAETFEEENPGFSSKTEQMKTERDDLQQQIKTSRARAGDDPNKVNSGGDDSEETQALKEKHAKLSERIENREEMQSKAIQTEITKRTEYIGAVAGAGSKIVDAGKSLMDAMFTNNKGAIDANKAILEAAKSTIDQLMSANSQQFSDCGNTIQGIIGFEEKAAKGIGQYAA